MKNIGFILSIIWLVIVTTVLFLNDLEAIRSLKPNEWGDVLAGVTAPLAFIWLVIGYFQQGEELKKNTEALRLQEAALNKQTEELQQGILHQQEMIKLYQKELSITLEEAATRREDRKRKQQPNLIFTTKAAQGGYDIGFKQTVSIKNTGSTISHVHFDTDHSHISLDKHFIHIWYSNDEIEINIKTPEYFHTTDFSIFSLEYGNEENEHWVQEYLIAIDQDTGYLSFEKKSEWQ